MVVGKAEVRVHTGVVCTRADNAGDGHLGPPQPGHEALGTSSYARARAAAIACATVAMASGCSTVNTNCRPVVVTNMTSRAEPASAAPPASRTDRTCEWSPDQHSELRASS